MNKYSITTRSGDYFEIWAPDLVEARHVGQRILGRPRATVCIAPLGDLFKGIRDDLAEIVRS